MTDEAWGERLAGLEEGTLDGGLTLIVARSFRERRRGLAKMTPLPAGYGLRILKCNSIHTAGMRFALDLVWLARDGRVLRVCRDDVTVLLEEKAANQPAGESAVLTEPSGPTMALTRR